MCFLTQVIFNIGYFIYRVQSDNLPWFMSATIQLSRSLATPLSCDLISTGPALFCPFCCLLLSTQFCALWTSWHVISIVLFSTSSLKCPFATNIWKYFGLTPVGLSISIYWVECREAAKHPMCRTDLYNESSHLKCQQC